MIEELIAIVIEAGELDPVFTNSLLMKYGSGDSSQQVQSCKKMIASIVKRYTGGEGFIKALYRTGKRMRSPWKYKIY